MKFKYFLKTMSVNTRSWSGLTAHEQGYHISDFLEGGGELDEVISFLNIVEEGSICLGKSLSGQMETPVN